MAYLIIFVAILHPLIALILCDDLASILDNDLVWFKRPITADAISTISCLDHFDPDIILSTLLVPLLETFKCPIVAVLGADVAVGVVAFVEHVAVQTVVITAEFEGANTS